MGEEFRLRLVGRDSTDDVPDSTRIIIYSRWLLGATQDGRLLYIRGSPSATNEIEFLERGEKGRIRRCFVQDTLAVWLMAVAPDRSFAVFSCGDMEEDLDLWLIRWRPPGTD
jgi:hypothetical protein